MGFDSNIVSRPLGDCDIDPFRFFLDLQPTFTCVTLSHRHPTSHHFLSHSGTSSGWLLYVAVFSRVAFFHCNRRLSPHLISYRISYSTPKIPFAPVVVSLHYFRLPFALRSCFLLSFLLYFIYSLLLLFQQFARVVLISHSSSSVVLNTIYLANG